MNIIKIIHSLLVIVLSMVVNAASGQEPDLCCIDFNKSTTFMPGTTYRRSNDSITSFCWYETRTDKLKINGKTYYNSGKLVAAPTGFGSGEVFNTNNITLWFKFINSVKLLSITFDYLDMGGTENLSINGKLYSGELDNTPASLGNANVSVTSTILPTNAKIGTVTITGYVREFKIGGQEFYIDNVCFTTNLKGKIPVD